jgi:hypothetical protein
MGRFPSKHRPSSDGPSSPGTLKNTRAQVCQESDFRVVRKIFLISTVVLLLASIAVPDLHADDVYPNCIVSAIDPNSGVITSQETDTGKTFYFQVTDRAQLEHVRIHQGIWIKNGHVSLDGVKPCACKVVSPLLDAPNKSQSNVPQDAKPTIPTPTASPQPGASAPPTSRSNNAAQPSAGARTGPAAVSAPKSPLTPKAPGSNQGTDLLIMRDGTKKSASLSGCGLTTCRVGTSVYPRQNIQWIGLGLNAKFQPTPPTAKSSTSDEIHFNDGSTRTVALLGIRANSVEAAGKSYDRKTVKWVHLIPVSVNQTPSGFEDQTPPDPGNESNTGGPPTQPLPPGAGSAPANSGFGSHSPRAPHEAVKACPVDKPLGGHIEVDSDWNQIGCRGSRRAIVRFPLTPGALDGPWHLQLMGAFMAPEVHYDLITAGCAGESDDHHMTCKAPNGRKTATVILGKRGPLGFIPAPDADGFIAFSAMKPEIAASTVLMYEEDTCTTPLECEGRSESAKSAWSYAFEGLAILSGPNCPASDIHDGKPIVLCVQPADCFNPKGAAAKECYTHPEQHAIIPFSGESTWKSPRSSDPRNQGMLSAKIRWEICCGCGGPSSPPDLSSDPCRSTAEADNRLKTNRIKRQLALLELDQHGAAYEEALKEANAHYPDYMKTVEGCLVQDAATDALIAMLAPELVTEETPEAVAHAIEWAEQKGLMPPMGMQLIAKIIDKIVSGEDPTTAIDREGKQVWAETFDAINKVETLIEGTRTAAGMEKTAEQCQGAFLVSAETKLSADKCVESFKAALAQLVEFNKVQNKIRDLDTQLPDLQYKDWAACVQCARSQGTDESACDHLKPDGNWPPVR